MPKAVLWEHVDSSNVNRVAYHDDTHTLCVEFRNGGLYTYPKVDLEHYRDLMGAQSVGKYLNTHIKSMYPFQRHESEADLLNSL